MICPALVLALVQAQSPSPSPAATPDSPGPTPTGPTVVITTSLGHHQGRAQQGAVPDHRGQLPEVRPKRLLRRDDLPPRDAELHDPGRRHDAGHAGEADAGAHPQRGQERPPQLPGHPRHGAHRRTPTARPRSSSSTCATTTAWTSASGAPATRCSARWWRGWTWWTRSSASPPPRRARTRTCP